MALDETGRTSRGNKATGRARGGELPIVSCFISDASWYSFTTRRIIGFHDDCRVDKPAPGLTGGDYGHFKGLGNQKTEIMTLKFDDGSEAKLEFETGKAAMAPMYAEGFWLIKYSVLDVFKG